MSSYSLPAIGRPPAPPMVRKIAVEEHFDHLGVVSGSGSRRGTGIDDLIHAMRYDDGWFGIVTERLIEFDAQRLAEMDGSGVDVAVLSQTVPGAQGIADAADAAGAARDINDFVSGVVARHPS